MLLRDAKEAFREGHDASRRTVGVSVRALSTKQGTVGVAEAVVLDRFSPPPARPRSSAAGGSKGGVKTGGALGLKEFMHRARVLDLYRGILKRARSIEDKDVAAEARRQFKASRDETDPLKIQMLVADASNHLEAMQGSVLGAGSSGGGDSWLDIDDPEDKRGRPYAPAALEGELGASYGGSSAGVDRGLGGVASSVRSSWSISSAIMPPMPNGEALPTLLSHLAELRSVCKQQRESGRSLRGALARKQGQLDDASSEASWLRAELGFIVGDMLGALQRNPTAGAIFSSLSERIRSDLGAEEAAVYIDIGDGTLWLLPPTGGGEGEGGGAGGGSGVCDDIGEDVFVQRGVGVVGLVAMGALPGAAAVPAGGGERAGGVDGGVDVLLLNEGLEAFDNGTTVEAALLTAARRRREGGGGAGRMRENDAKGGTVRNMLLARVGSGVASSQQGTGRSGTPAQTLPEPPTAVIQALNKQVAPERFTEGDARAVRTLAPAIAAGSRLILSLLNFSRSSGDRTGAGGGGCGGGDGGGEQRSGTSSFGLLRAMESSFVARCCEEELLLLRDVLKRAREGLGADRVRLFVLDPASEAAATGGTFSGDVGQLQLQLWHEDPAPAGGWARSSAGLCRRSGGADCAGGGGLHGVALSTGRAARSADALSDPLYDREPDVREGFLARSVLCAPLLDGRRSTEKGVDGTRGRRAGTGVGGGGDTAESGVPMGVLELTLGRGAAVLADGGQGSFEASGSGSQNALGESGGSRTRKVFVEGDEALAEAFARDVEKLLSRLLTAGFRPRASATTLAGGGGHWGSAGGLPPTRVPESEADGRAHWRQPGQSQEVPTAVAMRDDPDADGGRLTRADLGQPPPPPPPPQQQQQQSDPNNQRRGRATVAGNVEARDVGSRGPCLGSSSTSTAVGLSPLGAGVRASVATAGQKTPDDGPPPPSPATEGSAHGGSPSHHPREHGHVAQCAMGTGVADNSVKTQERQEQHQQQQQQQQQLQLQRQQERQRQQQEAEATQARSWATAQGVLEACKEGLAADKLSQQRRQLDGSITFSAAASSSATVESIAPAVRSLVSSLLPGCTAVLLLLDRATGLLREAGCGMHFDGAERSSPVEPRPVRHEDVARRALASGKALLSRMSEPEGAAQASGNGGGDDSSGKRIFCVPVSGSAERTLGVLQLFLPRPPAGIGGGSGGGGGGGGFAPPPLSSSSSSRANRGKTTTSRAESPPPLPPLPPPPPSFFMAAKIVSDSVGFALGWGEALDRREKAARADTSASTRTAKAAARAAEQSRAELQARHKEELRLAEQSHRARAAEAAESHARAVASLLKGREELALDAAKVLARARGRRDAARVLAAWRDVPSRARKAELNAARLRERLRRKAFRDWRSRTAVVQACSKAEANGAVASARRGLRRALGKWARVIARRRVVKERRLAGARLMAGLFRKGGPVKRCFGAWRVAAQDVLVERQALARKAAEEKREALVAEEVARAEARAHLLSARVADLCQRRRSERLARFACRAWFGHAQRAGEARENARLAGLWYRRQSLKAAMTRWLRIMVSLRPAYSPAPAALSAELSPPPYDTEPLARYEAEDGRDAPGSHSGSMMDHSAAAAATGWREAGRADPGAQTGARISGGERAPARRRGTGNAGAVPAAVTHSPIRVDAGTAQASQTAAVMSVSAVAASPGAAHRTDGLDHDNGGGRGGGGNGEATREAAREAEQQQQRTERLRLISARLADAAAGEFRQQRDKIFTLRVLAAWRCAAARERVKREAVSRLLRGCSWRRLNRGFAQWRAGARAARDMEEKRTARDRATAASTTAKEAMAAAAKAMEEAGVATAAKAAAEQLAREKEKELRHEKAAVEELRKTVERLQAESSESALRQQVADGQLRERSTRASLLSLAVAQVFRQGRERLLAARALKTLRDGARARRLASAAAARIQALRLSRALHAWGSGSRRRFNQRPADAKSAAAAGRVSALRRCLWAWRDRARRSRRRRGLVAAGVEVLSRRRKRTALWVLEDACRGREASAAAAARDVARLRLSRMRRGLRSWGRATFGAGWSGGGWCEVGRGPGGEGEGGRGSRVLARLEGVAAAVNAAGDRRRARRALCRWLGHAQGVRRRAAMERQAGDAFVRGNQAVTLLRWRALSLIRRRLRGRIDTAEAFAIQTGARKGVKAWRDWVQVVAARRKARLTATVATMGEPTQSKACPCPEPAEQPGTAGGDDVPGPAVSTPSPSPGAGREPPLVKWSAENPPRDDALTPPEIMQLEGGRARSGDETPRGVGGGGCGVGNRDLLDLLVDVCAAPPPYSLGSGVTALGHDACTVAMHTFGLLSASLFEVVGSSPVMAVRVAAVQAGGAGGTAAVKTARDTRDGFGAEGANSGSAAAAAVAAVAEFELPESERLGEGTVGVAAQSARPVCIEVVYPPPAGAGSCAGGHAAAAAAGAGSSSSALSGVASTVLCLPVMVQSAPLPKVSSTGLAGSGDGGGIQGGSTIPCVEVVGVLRAARAGTGAFAGDDARALSAFCGQVALAMVADRALAAGQAGRGEEAAKKARTLRREACRKVAKLFTEGAVAGALLRHAKVERQISSSVAAEAFAAAGGRRGAKTKEELWASVAGLAARALGCERVDLLRVTSLCEGGVGGGVADFTSSQRPPSRSFRKRSREALLAARASPPGSGCSSQGATSSRDGSGTGGGSGEAPDAIGSWLCVPVLSVPSSDGVGRFAGGSGGGDGGQAVTVCCAVNKRKGRNFDDVDEAMLGTIAALYAVASSWLPLPLPPPPTPAEPSVKGPPTTTTPDSSGEHTDANAGARSHQGAPAPAEPQPRATASRQVQQPSAGSLTAAAEWGHDPSRRSRSSRPEPRLLDEVSDQADRRAPSVRRRHEQPTQAEDVADGIPREYRSSGGDNNGSRGGSSATEAFRAINRAAEENVRLRERAERAERMLETTRGRLSRALEDGGAGAAAAETDAALKHAASDASHGSFNSNSSSGGAGGGSSSISSVLGARKPDEGSGERAERPRGRGKSPKRGSRKHAANAGAGAWRETTRRRSSSSSNSGGDGDGDTGSRSDKRRAPGRPTSTLPLGLSSSDTYTWEGECNYHSDETGERRWRWHREWTLDTGAAATEGEGGRRRRRQRRRSSSAFKRHGTLEDTVREGGRGGGRRHGRGWQGRDDDVGDVTNQESQQQPRREQQELRASDIARMRKVVARLRFATRELEAERARRRMDAQAAPARVVTVGLEQEEEEETAGMREALLSRRPASVATPAVLREECGCSQRPTRVMTPAGIGHDGGVAAAVVESEKEAAVLLRENASLRRRLFGLAAVEELETRAVREGLLPLTGGGAPGGDLFSSNP
eukprot:g13868.t1